MIEQSPCVVGWGLGVMPSGICQLWLRFKPYYLNLQHSTIFSLN